MAALPSPVVAGHCVQHWMLLGPGQWPALEVPPIDEQEPLSMQLPDEPFAEHVP